MIRLRQLMRIYLKNNPAEYHPDPIWNDGAFCKERRPNKNKNNNNKKKKKNNKMNSDMGSVPRLKIVKFSRTRLPTTRSSGQLVVFSR